MRILYKLNVMLGLASWPLWHKDERSRATLSEPDGAQRYRRNILALSGVVVLAFCAGADPQELNVFGVKPSGGWGVAVMGVAAMLAHVYWYALRYHHLKDEAILRHPAMLPDRPLSDQKNPSFVWRGGDLIANWVAFVLTLLSWTFIACWITGSP